MSTKRTTANQKNAERSTGPRTVKGKARSRQNAFKHGLAIPTSALPQLREDVLHLAEAIAGDIQDNPLVLQAAMRVAEAAIDVQRARRARVEILNRSRVELGPVPPISPERRAETIPQSVLCPSASQQTVPADNYLAGLMISSEKLELELAAFGNLASQLERLERYERRSVSRRDRAIRDFTEITASVSKQP
jgi:hypothetical protein